MCYNIFREPLSPDSEIQGTREGHKIEQGQPSQAGGVRGGGRCYSSAGDAAQNNLKHYVMPRSPTLKLLVVSSRERDSCLLMSILSTGLAYLGQASRWNNGHDGDSFRVSRQLLVVCEHRHDITQCCIKYSVHLKSVQELSFLITNKYRSLVQAPPIVPYGISF